MKYFIKLVVLSSILFFAFSIVKADELKFEEINADTLFKTVGDYFYNISVNQNFVFTAHVSYTDDNNQHYVVLANTTNLGKTWRIVHFPFTLPQNFYSPYNFFYDNIQNKYFVFVEGNYIYEVDFDEEKLISKIQLEQQDFVFQFYHNGYLYVRNKPLTSNYHAKYWRINLSNNVIEDITPEFSVNLSVYNELFSPWGDGLLYIYDLNDGQRNGKFLISNNNGDSWNQISVQDNIYDAAAKYDVNKIVKSDQNGMVYFLFYSADNKKTNLGRIYNNFQTIDTVLANDTTYWGGFTDSFNSQRMMFYYHDSYKIDITDNIGNSYRTYTTNRSISPVNLVYNTENNILLSRYFYSDQPIIYSQIPASVFDEKNPGQETQKLLVNDYLSLSEEMINKDIQIYNAVGELVFNAPITSTQVNVSSLPCGLYSVLIISGSNMKKMLIYKE